MENYYTYIIESSVNKKWYIGHTNDIERRLAEHNSGQNKSTKGKGPWRLIFLSSFNNNLDAKKFELKLKKITIKDFIKTEYSEFFIQ